MTITADRIEVEPSSRRLRATRIVAWVFTALSVFGLVTTVSFFPGGIESGHQIHDVAGFTILAAGLAAALVRIALRPGTSEAAVQQLLVIGTIGLIVPVLAGNVDGFSFLVIAIGVIVALVTPTRALPNGPKSRALLAGAVVALALVPYGIEQMQVQMGAGIGDPHAEFGHYTGMATFALMIPALAFLASTKGRGWRIPGWAAGVSATVLGIASLVFGVVSAVPTVGSVLCVAGGLVWIGLVEREARQPAV